MNTKLYKVHWKQLQGNPFVVPLDLMMFTSEGHQRVMKCYVKGEAVKLYPPTLRVVVFDVDFASEKIDRLLSPIPGVERLEDLQRLLDTAKENKKKRVSALSTLNTVREKHYFSELYFVDE